jgi:hypothetical protein
MAETVERPAQLYKKLCEARRKIQSVSKSKTAAVGAYSYSYATLEDVIPVVDQACNEVGLQWVQATSTHEDRWTLDTILIDDETGDAISFQGMPNVAKSDPQANGSALTYARRYGLVSLFGMVVSDDDGAQAHRAAVSPNKRTSAEEQIREWLGDQDKDIKTAFAADFKEEFGSTLTDLPESRHGEALAFQKFWAKA